MEALAALSLSCNILQLLGASFKAAAAIRQITSDHAPDTEIRPHAEILQKLAAEIGQLINPRPRTLTAEDEALLDRAKDVVNIATSLNNELDNYVSSRASKTSKVVRYVFKKDEISRLEQRLSQAQDALQSTIIIDLHKRAKDNEAVVHEQLSNLRIELQPLVTGLIQSNTNIIDLMRQQEEAALAATRSILLTTSRKSRDELQLNFRSATAEIDRRLKEKFAARDAKERDNVAKQMLRQFVESFYFETLYARQNTTSFAHMEGTFQWILSSKCHCGSSVKTAAAETLEALEPKKEPNQQCPTCIKLYGSFRLWLTSTDMRMFWISGRAGSGKSTLINYLARKSNTLRPLSAANDDLIILTAFLWSAGDDMQKSIKGLLCTLLYQLLRGNDDLATRTMNAKKSFGGKLRHSDWSDGDLIDVLCYALVSAAQKVYIFIDGLDELSTADGASRKLLALLKRLCGITSVKVCVSSRPEPLFVQALQHYPHLRLEDLTHQDLYHYVDKRIVEISSTLPDQDKDHTDIHNMKTWILRNANGVFLWVELVLWGLDSGLVNGDTWPMLWQRVQQIPKRLEDLYSSMLERRDNSGNIYKITTAIYFMAAIRESEYKMNSLLSVTLYTNDTLRQRLAASGVSPSEVKDLWQECRATDMRIRAQCAGLVHVPNIDSLPMDGTAKELLRHLFFVTPDFIHRTARDFILETGEGLWKDTELDRITYLEVRFIFEDYHRPPPATKLFEKFDTFDMDIRMIQLAQGLSDNQEQGHGLLDHLARMMQARNHWHRNTRNPVALAAFAGFDELMIHWWPKWIPDDMSIGDFHNHLLISAVEGVFADLELNQLGRYAVISRLLDLGADPLWVDGRDLRGHQFPSAMALTCDILKELPQIPIGTLSHHRNADWNKAAKDILRVFLSKDVNLGAEITVLLSVRPDSFFDSWYLPIQVWVHEKAISVHFAQHQTEPCWQILAKMPILTLLRLKFGMRDDCQSFGDWMMEELSLAHEPFLRRLLRDNVAEHIRVLGHVRKRKEAGMPSPILECYIEERQIRLNGLISISPGLEPGEFQKIWLLLVNGTPDTVRTKATLSDTNSVVSWMKGQGLGIDTRPLTVSQKKLLLLEQVDAEEAISC